VSIQDFFFSPAQITVQPGTTVTWVNRGKAPHTVTADDGSFDSGKLQPGQSFSHKFQNPGTVAYHCEIHPSMTASVTVGGGSGGGGATTGATTTAQPPASAQQLPKTGGSSGLSSILPIAGMLVVGGGLFGWAVVRRRSW
jgi:hypothetical protein